MPTRASLRPRAQTISVAEGMKETILGVIESGPANSDYFLFRCMLAIRLLIRHCVRGARERQYSVNVVAGGIRTVVFRPLIHTVAFSPVASDRIRISNGWRPTPYAPG